MQMTDKRISIMFIKDTMPIFLKRLTRLSKKRILRVKIETGVGQVLPARWSGVSRLKLDLD